MEADQMLFHAVNLIEAGNKTDGREMLKRVIGEHPNNADALFVFAQYCGKRSQSITALEQVLLLEPDYPGAREALERIKLMPPTQPLPPQTSHSAFVALEVDDPWSKALQVDPALPPVVPGKITRPPKKEKQPGLSKGLIAAAAGLFGVLVIVGLALAALLLSGQPPTVLAGAAPSATVESLPAAPATMPPVTLTPRPYHTPTATPDPCTCAAVETYMSSHLTRVNQLLAEMALTTKKLKRNTLKDAELATLVQSATQMYTAGRLSYPASLHFCLPDPDRALKQVLPAGPITRHH